MQSSTVLVLCGAVMMMVALRSVNGDACTDKLNACPKPEQGYSSQDIMGVISKPDALTSFSCSQTNLEKDATFVTCVFNELQSTECQNADNVATATQSKMLAKLGTFTKSRILDAFNYICKNKASLQSFTASKCLQSADRQAAATCAEGVKDDLVSASQNMDVCKVISLTYGCVNTASFPQCQENDLHVIKMTLSKIFPDGCYSSCGHVTLNLLLISLCLLVYKQFSG